MITALALVLALFLAPAAHATNNTAMVAAAGIIPYLMPLQPLSGNQFTVNVDPAYYTTKTNDDLNGDHVRIAGLAVAGGVNYAFTPHFALGALGFGFHGTGKDTLNSGQVVGASNKGTGEAAVGIYDPFSGDNFRLPILAGFGHMDVSSKFDYPVNPKVFPSGYKIKRVNSPGPVFGFSPQFNTGKWLRWEPFFIVWRPNNHSTCEGPSCSSQDDEHTDPGPTGGLNVVIRPWNMAFQYIPSIGAKSGSSFYALRFAHSFGGKTEVGAGATK